MSDDEMNLAICEARGWNHFERIQGWRYVGTVYIGSDSKNTKEFMPDHINGIEALGHIHEAEKLLNEQQQATYALFLHRNSKRHRSDHLGRDFDVLSSRARERLDALLRTLGLYKDTQ